MYFFPYEPFPALILHPIDERDTERENIWAEREEVAKGNMRYFTKVYISIYSVYSRGSYVSHGILFARYFSVFSSVTR